MRKLATLFSALTLFGAALGCSHTAESHDCGCADGQAAYSTHAAPILTAPPTANKMEGLQMPKGDSK